MTVEMNNAVVTLLASDALEAAKENPVEAATLLIDATVALLATCHERATVVDLADFFSRYMIEQARAAYLRGEAA